MRDAEFFERVAALLRAGEPFVTARLLETEGSVPQEVGAAMLVRAGGEIEGTIGGGRFEAQVALDGLALLEEGGPPRLETYALNRDELRMYCAGRARVLLEAFGPTAELLVFGGGHVGEALCRLAALCSTLRTVVIDDRAPFADPARHPAADRVIQTDDRYERDLPALGPWTYAVLVTRCHDVDKVLCRRLAPLDLAYLGVIGSKTKARTILGELEREGIPKSRLDAIESPIGVDLGPTKDPGEVAVSILAAVLRRKNERALRAAGSDGAREENA